MNRVASLYDTLFSFESPKQNAAYPIHKQLNLGEVHADLLDWLMDEVRFTSVDQVLDAGCGTGFGLLKLVQETGVRGKGISLAEKEVAFANRAANQLGLHQKVQFEVADFNTKLTEKYEKILAIESIKHSEEIEIALSNFVEGLTNNGVLIIADDFVKVGEGNLLQKHKCYWHVPGFDHHTRTIGFLETKDMQVRQIEMTATVPLRPGRILSFLLFCINILLGLSRGGFRMQLEIYAGGLLLEQLYHQDKVGYYVIIAQKK